LDAQLPHLETFALAAELCNLTAAAQALGLSQAAVSQRIQALEKSLGKPVFHRRGGRVLLTDAGRQLYDYAQRISALHREARQALAGQAAPLAGDLLLAASSIPGEHLLPMLLAGFGQQYPHIRVQATVTDSATVVAQVQRGQVCLGLVGRKDANPHLDFRPFAQDHMVLVVPPGHALERRKKILLTQLAAYPLVLRAVGSGLRHCLEKSLDKAGHSLGEFRVALELGSNEAIKEAVLQGVGVAFLSLYAVQKEVKARQLHALEVSDLRCDRTMYLVHDRRRVLPLPARLFLTYLETHPVAVPPS